MASGYPGALDNLATNHANGVSEVIQASTVNDLADAVNKIEAELGVLPKGSFANVGTRLGAMSTCRKTADQVSTSTTLVDVTEMAFPVVAGSDYFFEFYVVFMSQTATTGIGLALTFPTVTISTGSFSGMVEIARANEVVAGTPALANLQQNGLLTAADDAVVSDGVPVTANTTFLATVKGILSNATASGTVQLRFKAEVAAAGNVTVRRGSFGRMYAN